MFCIKTFDKIKTFPRSIHILVIGEAASALAMGIFNFLQILYYNYIGLSPEAIGFIFSIGSLFGLGGFFVGPFIRIFGRKNLLCFGVLILSIGIGMNIAFTRYIIILIAQIIISIGISLIQVTELQLLFSYTIESKESCAYSYKYSSALIANAIGILIAGNMNKISWLAYNGYKKLFLVAFVILIVTGALRYFFLPRDITVDGEYGEAKKMVILSILAIKQDRRIRLFAMLLFLVTLSMAGVGPYNNLILKIVFNLNNETISFISFTLTIFSMIGVAFMSSIMEKIGIGKFNLIIFSGAVTSCFLLSVIGEANLFVIILVIRCIFMFIIGSALESLMMSNIDLDRRDIFASVKILINGIAVSIGNFCGGYILNNYGYRGNYVYGGVLMIIGSVFFYSKVRKFMDCKDVPKKV